MSVGSRGTKYHWVNPWKRFGGLLVVINYQWKKEELRVIMSKNIESQLVVGSNEDIAAASFTTFNGGNIEEYDKQDIGTNMEF